MANEGQLARALGWASLGLGLPALINPRGFARFVGAHGDDESTALARMVGAREIVCGLGILTNTQPTGFLWGRVAGDLMDLALLSTTLRGNPSERKKTIAATAAALGITALDLYTSLAATRNPEAVRRDGTGTDARAMTKAITVNRPADELYRFWHNFENLPRFMEHLESVRVTGNGRSHWTAKAPAGATVEWDAEIVEDRPNEVIAWRSVDNADVYNAGVVRFERAPGGRGTEVRVEMEYRPPAGALGATVARLFGEEPTQQVGDALRQFKQVVETGEVVHSDASIYGRPHSAQPPDEPIVHNGVQPALATH